MNGPDQHLERRGRTSKPRLVSIRVIATTLAALAIGVGATLAASLATKREVIDEARARFERLNERLSEETARRVNQTRYGLNSARGLFAASETVERYEFAAYIATRNLPADFPGAIGFGLIERVQRTELEGFVQRERESGVPDFRVYGLAPEGSPLANMPDLFVIRYCFPRERNANAWGLDVGSETERRLAAERAVRTGEASISGRIVLVQDGKRQTAFLYYLPVYQNGADTSTPELREPSRRPCLCPNHPPGSPRRDLRGLGRKYRVRHLRRHRNDRRPAAERQRRRT